MIVCAFILVCLNGLECFTNKSKEAVVFLCLRKLMDGVTILFTTNLNGKFSQVVAPLCFSFLIGLHWIWDLMYSETCMNL